MDDRRSGNERRLETLIDEAVSRRRERRQEERRDSLRSLKRFWVRPLRGGVFEAHEGDVSLYGAGYLSLHPPTERELEFGMWVPGLNRELRTVARVVNRRDVGTASTVHLKFDGLDTESELALAKFLDGVD